MANTRRFGYGSEVCAALSDGLSIDRFQTYLTKAGTEAAALQLYAWNTAIAAAFHGPLQACEVILRNAVHETLSDAYGATWFDQAAPLQNAERSLVHTAEGGILVRRNPMTPGRVIAELSFGFWVRLFSNRYDRSLWRTDLAKRFAPRPQRKDLHDQLDRLRTLRNRIAHHEPIFQRNLNDDFNRVVDILMRLSPDTANWVHHHSRVYGLLKTLPSDVESF